MARDPLRIALVLVLGLAFAPTASLQAQPASRVKDINPGWNSKWPHSLTAAGGRAYFVADDGPHGDELWTSEGSEGGTVRVAGTSGVGRIYAAGTGVYFSKSDGLWRSDGTEGGTALVKTGLSSPSESAVVGPITFFAVGNAGAHELWRTDGTSAGTFRVLASDGQGPTGVRQLVASSGLVFFIAYGDAPLPTLWRSDGSAAGTWPLSGSSMASSRAGLLAALAEGVVFAANDGVHGFELWKSDGTLQGTTFVADLISGSSGSGPAQMITAGGVVFFTAAHSEKGRELWVTDGTSDGTHFVADITPGPFSTSFVEMQSVGKRLFFTHNGDDDLWTSDGTAAGTVALRAGLMPALLRAVGTQLFFVANAYKSYGDLWASDGTPAGTRRVRTICPAGTCSQLREQIPVDGTLLFPADDGVFGPQLWRSDGTAEGTQRVAVIRPGEASSRPRDFRELDGKAYFLTSTSNQDGDTSIHVSDGTAGGTHPVVTNLPGFVSLRATRRALFWVGRTEYPRTVLMMSDGTAAGTGPVPVPPELTVVGRLECTSDKAFFYENISSGLWATDGTSAGTEWLGESWGGLNGGFLGWMSPFADDLLFLVRPLAGGQELWRSDGTASGTSIVKALSPRTYPVCGSGSVGRLGRSLLFHADDGSTGCKLWRTDGTPEGTVLVSAVGLAGDEYPTFRTGSARGFLALTRNRELWRTDGTADGTFLLLSLPEGDRITRPGAGAREGVYFAVQRYYYPSTTEQLWFTDGTVAGTVLLRDFQAAPEKMKIMSLGSANGRLVLSVATDSPPPAIHRWSIWTSDGTPAGTVKVQDDVNAEAGGLPFRGVTLFAGIDPWAGTELWAMDGRAFAAPLRPTSLFILSPCRVFDTRLDKGFLGGPAIAAGAPRVFPVGGVCGIPATARAIAANVTVTGATAGGLLRVHASDIGAPDATVLNVRAGQTRANNATIGLGTDAEITVRFEGSAGHVHVLLTVVGWYE